MKLKDYVTLHFKESVYLFLADRIFAI